MRREWALVAVALYLMVALLAYAAWQTRGVAAEAKHAIADVRGLAALAEGTPKNLNTVAEELQSVVDSVRDEKYYIEGEITDSKGKVYHFRLSVKPREQS